MGLQEKENVYLVSELECVLILGEELLKGEAKKVEKESQYKFSLNGLTPTYAFKGLQNF